MNATVGYVAVEPFDPSWGESWFTYVEWSKLDHLKEVVSLDCSLCPSIIGDPIAEDWDYIVYDEVDIFGNLDYLRDRIKTDKPFHILALMREPNETDVLSFQDPGFVFEGFDLIDESTRISALTNCGGFDLAFQGSDLTEHGLIWEFEKAYRVKELLKKNYPQEPHADCVVWALWKMRHAQDL
jgi:hypothetical protein